MEDATSDDAEGRNEDDVGADHATQDRINGDLPEEIASCSSSLGNNTRQDSFPGPSSEQAAHSLSVTPSTSQNKKAKKPKLRRILPANQEAASPIAEFAAEGSSPLSCTEYAQYLGLQPTVKFKCFKCGEAGFSSITELKEHQNMCLKSSRSSTPDSGTQTNNLAQNLRITRKVYMCSSCGTYFENWNLYIHMREVHRRHVCLACLSMFMHAEKLALHMSSNHNTTMEAFATADDFIAAHPSSSYLTCCTCERIFSEQDNFFDHQCEEKVVGECRGCAMCGLQFAHTQNCPHSDSASKSRGGTPGERNLPVASTPGSSKQQKGVDSLEDKRKNSSGSSETLPAKSGIKKRIQKTPVYLEPDGKLNAASVCEVGMISPSKIAPPKLKPTCLRIKLAPVSKKPGTKKTPICLSQPLKADDTSSDNEETPSLSIDLNEELELLADESSNLRNLYNGDRSPSIQIPPAETESIDPLDTGQESDNFDEIEGQPTETMEEQPNETTEEQPNETKEEQPTETLSKQLDKQIGESSSSSESENEQVAAEHSTDDMDVDEPTTVATSTKVIHKNELGTEPSDHPGHDSESEDQIDDNLKHESSDQENNLDHSEFDVKDASQSDQNELDSEQDNENSVLSEQDSRHDNENCLLSEDSSSHNSINDSDLNTRQETENVDHRDDNSRHSEGSDENDVHSRHESEMSRKSHEEKQDDFDQSTDRCDSMDVDGEHNDINQSRYNDDEDDDDKDEWQIDENREEEEGQSTEHQEQEPENSLSGEQHQEPSVEEQEEEFQVAGEDCPLIELSLEAAPDQLPIQNILKLAIQGAYNYSSCVYCTHAKKIAVNGKQLAIHLVSEHRYQMIVDSEKLSPDKFVDIVKNHSAELESSFFNCDTYDNSNKENISVFVKMYECFQCRYITKVHKDLFLHNRKMHQKNGLVCIMCKSNFYSYSELLCHLCPGVYMVTNQPLFRCCFCSVDDLPSAFRFMVHVRKRHQACDVCLEITGDQQKLSNHVWKHKLHHFCYRCGIAYRNKPDITKHLFWKHGTESVLCKRCLQKKWPYVYHFCIPPSLFTCEECNSTFSRAVALKVHKRLHTGELLYPCELCTDSFISRKLLARHDRTIHNPPPPEETPVEPEVDTAPAIVPVEEEAKSRSEPVEQSLQDENAEQQPDNTSTDIDKQPSDKKVVDVYDLPPLNLSSESEDDSDFEDSKKPATVAVESSTEPKEGGCEGDQDTALPAVDSVWENFKDYKSSKDPKTSLDMPSTSFSEPAEPSQPVHSSSELWQNIMFDHDYFVLPESSSAVSSEIPSSTEMKPAEEIVDVTGEANTSFEHNYCNNDEVKGAVVPEDERETVTPKKKQKTPKKKHKSGDSGSSSSDSDSSSSGSDSSSCSCGTNCSCSSSSSSSSGSSSSDSSDSDSSCSEKRAQRKARRRERAKNHKHGEDKKQVTVAINGHNDMSGEEPNVEDVGADSGPPVLLFHESDLDTNESETDEDFYDEHPRLLMPSRNLLMLSTAADSLLTPQLTPAPTPPPSEVSRSTTPLNNGMLAQEALDEPLDAEAPINNLPVKQPKGKKRKRSLSNPRRENKLKISIPNILSNQLKSSSIPKLSVQKKVRSKPWAPIPDMSPSLPPASVLSPNFPPPIPATPQFAESVYSPGSSDVRGSGSETDSNLRLSKRRRVPKKFYGDSSDEEGGGATSYAPAPSPLQQQLLPQQPPQQPLPPPSPLVVRPPKKKARTSSVAESEVARSKNLTEADLKLQAVLDYVAAGYDGRTANDSFKKTETPKTPKLVISLENHTTAHDPSSSSDSSSEESESEEDGPTTVTSVVPVAPLQHQSFLQRPIITNRHDSVKLYCYCQCPYDEVSEMIACDGKNCAIEWFHFECVGITVPPKGKWYCPDCRKRYNIAEPLPNPQYFYNASSEYMLSSTEPSYTEI